jgi:hypothetical protein
LRRDPKLDSYYLSQGRASLAIAVRCSPPKWVLRTRPSGGLARGDLVISLTPRFFPADLQAVGLDEIDTGATGGGSCSESNVTPISLKATLNKAPSGTCACHVLFGATRQNRIHERLAPRFV